MPLPELLSQLPPQPLPQAPFRSRGFLLFASFGGDYVRTAQAAGVTLDALKECARELQWDQKLASLMTQVRSQKPGDLERAINRSLCFVQAHQLREILDKIIQDLYGMTSAELIEQNTPKAGANKGTFNGRALADLVTAAEKCHAMLYASLGDTAGERSKRALLDDGDPGQTPSDAFASMARQVAEMAGGGAREMLLAAQDDRAQALLPGLAESLSEAEAIRKPLP
jgi:hypothetical protein